MRHRLAFRWCLVLVMMIVTGPSVAMAQLSDMEPRSVVVMQMWTKESDSLAIALTKAVKDQVLTLPGWTLVDRDESMELLALALNCPSPPDGACESRIAGEMGVSRYIWGTIDEQNGRAVGALHLWQRGQTTMTANLSYPASLTNASDPRLQGVVKEAMLALSGGGPKGTVQISAGDLSGKVYVDGQYVADIEDGSATVLATAGTRHIEVRVPGEPSLSDTVEVVAGEQATLTLQLPAKQEAPSSEEPSSWTGRKTAGVVLMTTGVVAAGGGLVSQLMINKYNNDGIVKDVRGKIPGDICDEKNLTDVNGVNVKRRSHVLDICSKASTYEVLQFVFYGVGAATFGTGLYLYLSGSPDKDDEQTSRVGSRRRPTSVMLAPAVARDGGGLLVDVRF